MRERAQKFDSRQVMQRENFEIFHYRQLRSGNLEVHHHDFYEVYFLVSSELSYWVEGRVIRLTPGDLLYINPMLARQQLASGEAAGLVCRNCGFSDYTSFYRAFKSEYGISPREFSSVNSG